MKKKLITALLVLLLIAIVGLFVREFTTAGSVAPGLILRTVALAVLVLSTIARVNRGSPRGNRVRQYAELYRDHLRSAFTAEGKKWQYTQLLLAVDRYNTDRYTAAIRILDGLRAHCETSDDHCAVLLFTALSYSELGQAESAMQTYYALLRHDNTRSYAWSNLGLLYKKQGKHKDALGCFANAVKYDDKNPYAYNNIASTCFALGDYAAAIEHADRALALKPDLYQASNTLCLCYAVRGDREQCEAYFARSVSNGADAKGLREAVESVSSGRVATETIVPIPDDVKRAMADFYAKTALPYLRACLPAKRGLSRFGGLPVGEPPLDPTGKPMRLVAALDCREVRGIPDFPELGVLTFYAADDGMLGIEHGRDGFRVSYAPDATLDEPTDAIPESDDGSFPIRGCYRLQLVPDIAAMNDADYRFDDTLDACLRDAGAPPLRELDADVLDAVREQFHSEGHRIGGYPHFTQEDPRACDESLREYDTLLLQVDSHYSRDEELIMIGDAGVMNFFIPREKLKRREFDDVYFTWDCG